MAEQERIEHVLTDTISMLCKSSVQCYNTLKIQGLLGITVDESNVFLVALDNQCSISNVNNNNDDARVNTNLLKDGVSMLCKKCIPFSFNLTIQGLLGLTVDVGKVVLVSFYEVHSNTSDENQRGPVDEYQLLQDKLVTKLLEANKCETAAAEHIRELSNSMHNFDMRYVLQTFDTVMGSSTNASTTAASRPTKQGHESVGAGVSSLGKTIFSTRKTRAKRVPECVDLKDSESEDKSNIDLQTDSLALAFDVAAGCDKTIEFSGSNLRNMPLKCEEIAESSTAAVESDIDATTNDSTVIIEPAVKLEDNLPEEGRVHSACQTVLTSASASAIFDDSSRQPAAAADSVVRQQQSTDNLYLADDALKCCRDDDCDVASLAQPSVVKQQQQQKGRTLRARTTQQHVNLENSTESICLTCGKSCSSHRELRTHKCNYSGVTTCSSGKSSRPFAAQKKMEGTKSHASKQQCDNLQSSATTTSTCQTHVKKMSTLHPDPDAKRYPCTTCSKTFLQARYLKSHMCRHTTVQPLTCWVCGKGHHRLSELKSHMRYHDGYKAFACKTCGKAFFQSSHLTCHERVHTEERPYKCKTCKNAYNRSESLTRHLRVHSNERPYPCTVCSKSFRSTNELTEHVRTHTGEKPYVCRSCGLAFSQMHTLRSHELLHTGEKSHACETCGKAYLTKEGLGRHLRVHTGEKPHVCETCGKAYVTKEGLGRHRHVHTGEKLYECDICLNKFVTRWLIVRHMRIHTGERTYKCIK